MGLLMLLSLIAVIDTAGGDSLNCSYLPLLDHLGVGPHNHTFSASRPVKNWRTPTYVTMNLFMYVIIDVNEKFQSFTTQGYISLSWTNELLSWDPQEFCGIQTVNVPKEHIWKPDISIMESMEKKVSFAESPHIQLLSPGRAFSGESLKITSTCKMDLYKFPFDTQRCLFTVLSNDNIDQVRLFPSSNSSDVTTGSLTVFQTQGEWDLISVWVSKENLTIGTSVWDQVVYTITITRRPQLYVINFLIPILCFLVLDLVSFFINESRGEKLSFKVTILLAISVLLLILHDILPSTHQKTPLIGMFCTGVFMFVGCSIVETIIVSFLMRMASKWDTHTLTWRTPEMRDGGEGRKPAGKGGVGLSMEVKEEVKEEEEKEGKTSMSQLSLILRELRALRLLICSAPQEHPGKTGLYLKTAAKCINAVYFLLYICAASVFLTEIGKEWYY